MEIELNEWMNGRIFSKVFRGGFQVSYISRHVMQEKWTKMNEKLLIFHCRLQWQSRHRQSINVSNVQFYYYYSSFSINVPLSLVPIVRFFNIHYFVESINSYTYTDGWRIPRGQEMQNEMTGWWFKWKWHPLMKMASEMSAFRTFHVKNDLWPWEWLTHSDGVTELHTLQLRYQRYKEMWYEKSQQ